MLAIMSVGLIFTFFWDARATVLKRALRWVSSLPAIWVQTYSQV
uniref:Uncharacterized protein n=1 Tax=Anguilla anguilla TaxID=7936 RepID=A0A0E9UPB6_ANGAN